MSKPSTSRSAPHRPLTAARGVATCLVIAGCGSSSSSSGGSAITVGAENTQGGKGTAEGERGRADAEDPQERPALERAGRDEVPTGPAPSKLVIHDLIKGTGAEAKLGDSITVNYVGFLYKTGKVFDSSWMRGEPSTFTLETGSLIAGWTQGIPGMKVGGRRELIIPAALAYGAKGTSSIPANSPLVFVIDLLGT